MQEIRKPALNTPEGQKLIKDANKGDGEGILGHCMFCTKAILTDECQANGSINYVVQVLNFKFPDTTNAIIKPTNAFLYHTKCIAEAPYRYTIVKQLGLLEVDFQEINDKYIELMAQEQIKHKHQKNLQDELEQLKVEDKDNETQGPVSEDDGNA